MIGKEKSLKDDKGDKVDFGKISDDERHFDSSYFEHENILV